MSAEAQPELENNEAFDLGVLSDPAEYKPGDSYRFLVHVALSPQDKLEQLLVGTGNVFQAADNNVVCTSLIDQDNPWVFMGGSAFIIKGVMPGDVAAAYSTDTGLARPHNELHFANGDEILKDTKLLGYNQININRGVVNGVMIRVDADSGVELGSPQINAQMRRIAEEHHLPIAEIPIKKLELDPGFAKAYISTGVAGAKLLQVIKPSTGKLVKIDITDVAQGSPLDYAGTNPGYLARAMIIDGHGQVIENDTNLSEESRELIKLALTEASAQEGANAMINLARPDIDRWLAASFK